MAMVNTPIVETHSLSKRFGSGVLAVDGVDMSVRRGEAVYFVGLIVVAAGLLRLRDAT
jgi:ABC-type branched-subunit amino acid transport system ATPase component